MWHAWLIEARSFAFHGEHSRFTALKKRRGGRAYLGATAELSLDRLNAVAAELARRADPAAPDASPHTARTHIKNLYGKLEAHSGVQAVERARALGLL